MSAPESMTFPRPSSHPYKIIYSGTKWWFPRLYCFLGALAIIPPRGKPGHCPRQTRKKMEGRGSRTNRLPLGLTGKDFRLREQGCGCFQPLQDRQAKAGRTWTRCSVLAPAVCCDLCGPHYLSSRSQPLGFSILLLLCCILGNLLRAMFQFRISSLVLSDWLFWSFFSELLILVRLLLLLELPIACILSLWFLYFTFLKHFLFIWKQISDSMTPGWGRSSPQCTPGSSPFLGTQSFIGPPGMLSSSLPFSSWEQASHKWGVLCTRQALPSHAQHYLCLGG